MSRESTRNGYKTKGKQNTQKPCANFIKLILVDSMSQVYKFALCYN